MPAKYASLHNHISSKKMLPKGSIFLLRRFLFPREVREGVKELALVIVISLQHGEKDIHAENSCFHIMNEKVKS